MNDTKASAEGPEQDALERYRRRFYSVGDQEFLNEWVVDPELVDEPEYNHGEDVPPSEADLPQEKSDEAAAKEETGLKPDA